MPTNFVKEQQTLAAVLKVNANIPKDWRKSTREIQQLLSYADCLLRELYPEEIARIFPEEGNCTIKARWEVIWMVDAYKSKKLGEIGLSEFLASYRINRTLRRYRSIREFVRLLHEPHGWGERIEGLFFRLLNIFPA